MAVEQQQRVKDLKNYMQKHSSSEGLGKEMIAYVQDRQKAFNMESISNHLDDILDSWKKLPLNIAVTGQSGSGKSTFINTVRGLAADDKGAANIGRTEELHSYPHPDNPNLLLWDLPGVGTPKFPRDTYLQNINFKRFVCYIIITSERFTDNDMWLAKQIDSKGKKFYFIRSKVDQDIRNEKHDYPELFAEEKLIEKLRQNCKENLRNAGFENAPVFIISGCLNHKDKWEFSNAIEKVTTDLPVRKQEAILLSLTDASTLTEGMIDRKKQYLAARNRKVSMLAALGGICPLPGFNVLADYKIISVQKDFYCKQFGLSDKMKEEHENKIMKSVKQGMSTVQIITMASEYIALRLAANAEKNIFSQLFIQVAKMATNTLASYKLVSITLEEILKEYADIAKQEIRGMVEKAGNDFQKNS